MNVMPLSLLITLTLCAMLSACAAHTPFPPEVTEKISPTFHFEAWRDAGPTNEAGKSDAGIKVQLGGRIVQATKNGKGIVMVAAQLPIVNHPVYGPTEDVTRTGDYEFAFLYPGEIEALDLMRGNRFIMVGTTTSRRPVLVNGIPKTEPFLIADCIHVGNKLFEQVTAEEWMTQAAGGNLKRISRGLALEVSERGRMS